MQRAPRTGLVCIPALARGSVAEDFRDQSGGHRDQDETSIRRPDPAIAARRRRQVVDAVVGYVIARLQVDHRHALTVAERLLVEAAVESVVMVGVGAAVVTPVVAGTVVVVPMAAVRGATAVAVPTAARV